MLQDQTVADLNAESQGQDVQEMLLLAARLKEAHGGELDDSAIMAVAEATGASPEYVRLALRSVPEKEHKRSPLQKVRNLLLSFDPAVRRYVMSGYLACGAGLANALLWTYGDRGSLLGIAVMLGVLGALYNAAIARDRQVSVFSGALFGGLLFLSHAVFLFLLSFVHTIPSGMEPPLLFVYVIAGGLAGTFAHSFAAKHRAKLGLVDPATERQELLRQLVTLQDKLRSDEQTMSFLSIDIVGSTRMKEVADPLAIEFTFTEYQKYVESITHRHGGRVHSTAGDGVTCAFEHPQQAFAAARNIQAGLIELNLHRNRIGIPIKLRAGIHHGSVMTPGPHIQNINFAHVIDIAAHIQKACPEGGVAVSVPAAGMLAGGPDVVGTDSIDVQNVTARIWRPRSTVALPAGAPAPPKFQPES